MEFRRTTREDIPAILDVQAANFIGNLEEVERQDGFLSSGLGMARVGGFVFSGKPYHILAFHVRSENGNGAASKPASEKT